MFFCTIFSIFEAPTAFLMDPGIPSKTTKSAVMLNPDVGPGWRVRLLTHPNQGAAESLLKVYEMYLLIGECL